MNSPTLLDYANVFGTLATPLLILFLTAIGWKIRTGLERRFELEDKLREDRVVIYNDILEPFIILLMSDAAWNSDKRNRNKNRGDVAVEKILSLDYRKQSFRLTLMGSDDVVISHNSLMQFFYQRVGSSNPYSEEELKQIIFLLGNFLLEIRKSMGNEDTKLDSIAMLEWVITDARKYR